MRYSSFFRINNGGKNIYLKNITTIICITFYFTLFLIIILKYNSTRITFFLQCSSSYFKISFLFMIWMSFLICK